MKPLSTITEKFTESVIREMTRVSNARGGINMSQGFPEFDPPEELKAAAITAIREGRNQYSITYGEPDLREAVTAKARQYNHIDYDPETEITITCGATEAMIATLKALVNPGDEIIIFEPFYENYGPDGILSGARPQYVSLTPPEWTYEPKDLAGAFNENSKAIIINTPNNPTGKVFSRQELEEIAELCIRWDCFVVTDEIYEHILFDGQEHISMASLEGMADRTVTISGLGKTYAVTGWRVGWAVAAPQLTALIRKVHDYLTICAPSPFQAAGIVALGLPDGYYDQMRAQYAGRRAILLEALKQAGLPFCQPEGAYYVMVDFGDLEWDMEAFSRPDWTHDRAFAEYIARDVGVAVVPGSSFYDGGDQGTSRIRFNFAKREDTLHQAARRLRRLRRA